MLDLTRRRVLGGAAASLASVASGTFARGITPSAFASLRRAIDSAMADAIASRAAPGFSFALGRGNDVLLTRGYGQANLETDTAVRPEGVFRIGSLTKQFTAAAAVRLSELGQIKLTGPIGDYLPAFSRLPSVSIAELIHHTAGLHDDDSEGGSTGAQSVPDQIALANAIARQVKPFDFAPGTAWHYSNANYIILGAIIEKLAGKPLADAVRALVLDRLGPTTLAFDTSAAIVPNRVSGYSLDESGRKYVHAPYIEIAEAGGAGAMRGNAPDLVRWHQALIGGRVLGREGLAFLLAPGRLRDGRLSGANRFTADEASYGQVQYGGGLFLSPAGTHPRTISHNGFINGFAAVLETNLDTKVTFAVLANADVGPNLPFRKIRAALRAFEAAGH
jgi:D-alanyl-D-alanine carboxypeptidase